MVEIMRNPVQKHAYVSHNPVTVADQIFPRCGTILREITFWAGSDAEHRFRIYGAVSEVAVKQKFFNFIQTNRLVRSETIVRVEASDWSFEVFSLSVN